MQEASPAVRVRSWGLALLALAALAAWAVMPGSRTAVSVAREAAAKTPAELRPTAQPRARVPTVAAMPAAVVGQVANGPERSADEQALALLDTLATRMHHELYLLPGAAELRRCAPFASAACRAQLSAALYELLDGSIVPAIEQGEIALDQLVRHDSAAARAPLLARLEQSSDPVERVAALLLLDRASQLEPGALPSAALRGLAERPVVEAQLLLTYGQHAGLPDDAAVREVAALAAAAGTDARVQGAALNALARRNAPELIAAVQELTPAHSPEWSGWSELVAPALSRCGLACADQTVEVVAAASDPPALAAQVLRRCPPPERAALLARLAPALPDSALALARENAEL